MAGRPTRSKMRPPMQPREAQCRAKWTASLTKTMVEVMVDQVHEGHKQNNSFSKKGWNCISDEFRKRTNLTWERDQLKSRHIALKKQYATVKLLLDHIDFKWDETTGLITATDEAWDKYIKDHPDAESVRTTGCPFYKELGLIFEQSGSRGTSNGSTVQKDGLSGSILQPQPLNAIQEELSDSESEEVPETNDQEILQSVSSPTTDNSRRGGRRGVDGAIAKAISEMAAASRLRASAIKKCNEHFTIAECISALDELEGIDDKVYYAALDLFNDRATSRETFLSLKFEKRLAWLIAKLFGPPTNVAMLKHEPISYTE